MSEKQIKTTQIIWETTIIKSIKQIMIISHNELYHQVIKVQKINHQIQVQFNHDCCEQIHKKSILHVISWENESRRSCLSIQTTHHCKSWSIYREIKIKMSTIEHSQMNDQTERLNQIVKQYLKCYVNYQQNNWIELLLTAQFTYNNSMQAFTEISSFQAEYRQDMQINDKMIKLKENNKQAIQQNKKIWQIHK